MNNYSVNYLEITTKTYSPKQDNLRYYRSGTYMFSKKYKAQVIKDVGDAGLILLEYFYDMRTYAHFNPTDNKRIANDLNWTASKVARVKTVLTSNEYLLILKDTNKDGSKLYRILLGKDLVQHYKVTNNLSNIKAVSFQNTTEVI